MWRREEERRDGVSFVSRRTLPRSLAGRWRRLRHSRSPRLSRSVRPCCDWRAEHQSQLSFWTTSPGSYVEFFSGRALAALLCCAWQPSLTRAGLERPAAAWRNGKPGGWVDTGNRGGTAAPLFCLCTCCDASSSRQEKNGNGAENLDNYYPGRLTAAMRPQVALRIRNISRLCLQQAASSWLRGALLCGTGLLETCETLQIA